MNSGNEFNKSEYNLFTFDPIVMVLDVLRRWKLVVLIAVAFAVGTFIVTDASYQPVYKTTTSFVVTTRGSSSTVYTNLASTTTLASVFEELLNSSLLRSTILEETGIDSFDGTIETAAVAETNLLTMTVTASDPRTAFLVAQAIIDNHEVLTYEVVDGVVLEVLQSPTVPVSPSNYNSASSRMEKVGILAAAAAVVLMMALSYLRDAVRSSTEARKKLECSYLGEIPHERKHKTLSSLIRSPKSSILINSPATGFHFVESIRMLRRRVEQHCHGRKVLMVTSLLENEGKSTVAANLALSMAQKRKRVLLIDCDLRKPACFAVLEQKNFQHGLGKVLAGRVPVQEAIIHDKKGNLDLLLEKRSFENSADLISSGAMRSLLEWARQEYDFVVLDLPPMAVASDAESMTDLADASLLVVRQNAAVVKAINKAVAALERGNAKLLGCVLNNTYSTALTSGQGSGYGGYGKYHYYGRYGRYGAYGSKKSE